jgi:C4-dicarboxylate transporter DctQ subunit
MFSYEEHGIGRERGSMSLLRRLSNFFDRFLVVMAVLAGILLIFSLLSINMEVASRYFLGRPMGWVTEISEYSLLYITFLAAAWVLKREGHVRMDIVLNYLSPRTQIMLDVFTSVISAIVCFILSWFGIKVTYELFQTAYFTPTVLELPKFIIVAIIFIGSILLLIQFLRRTSGHLSSWRALRDKEQSSGETESKR